MIPDSRIPALFEYRCPRCNRLQFKGTPGAVEIKYQRQRVFIKGNIETVEGMCACGTNSTIAFDMRGGETGQDTS